MKEEFVSHSPDDTERIGEAFAKMLSPGSVAALFGGLGMGKTAFVRGLARGLRIPGEVSSPTFALVHEYRDPVRFCHFDMYRVTGWDDLDTTGYYDYLDEGFILAVEWSENIEAALPSDAFRVEFECLSETDRRITITRDCV
ncbi:MAG: tRNA (adenosine(37)-N6)-threonylcarbamoyltransferase complex ATPase subunit type 1 TsaE [Clostridiales bacterium]|nr:tRNA (adenosine(37)-N6)-threonylcarbamoyltransferase complex ATPase subunit type 1 TsaE [Clostridiales bacterium]